MQLYLKFCPRFARLSHIFVVCVFYTVRHLAMAGLLEEQPVITQDEPQAQQDLSNSSIGPTPLGPNDPSSSHEATGTTHPSLRHRPSNVTTVSQSHPNHSTVNLDFFDPSGTQELKRALSRKSQHGQESSCSDKTLNDLEVGDGPFDLERFLRNLMNKYVMTITAYLYA